ncbi:hypothetical protein POUND7_003836, partial [Theobroma cacao]
MTQRLAGPAILSNKHSELRAIGRVTCTTRPDQPQRETSVFLLLAGDEVSGLPRLVNSPFVDFSSHQFEFESFACYTSFSSLKKLEKLDLTNNYFNTNIFSSFSQFKSLKTLIMPYNDLKGSFPINGSKGLLSLKKLEILDLNNNLLSSSILSSLTAVTSLRTLILSNNNMEGSFPIQELIKLKNLEMLDLSGNRFNASIQGFAGSGSLNKLLVLDLSNNRFSNSAFLLLSAISSLKTLILSNNKIEGSLPIQEFTRFQDLELLDLSDNKFNGSIQGRGKHLIGKIGDKLTNITHLELLDISNNNISGGIPDWIGNISSLTSISMSKNLLKGSIPDQLCSLKNPKVLDLSENRFSGSLSCLLNISSLRFLYLQRNGLSGLLSNALLSESSRLSTLDLRENKLSGSIPPWINTLSKLRILLLAGNHLE